MSEVWTLLLRLEGPMQSWGYRSRFDYRDTALEPTRSGVIGMICAAMGIARGEPISQFDVIRFGVRVDKEGRVELDYHTALDVIKADGKGTDTVVSYRDYLADASFTAGLASSNKGLLDEIENALKSPVWPLFLGRREFPLAENLLSAAQPSIVPYNLEKALEFAAMSIHCSPLKSADRQKLTPMRIVVESPDGERTQHDWPLCFGERRFKPRSIRTNFIKPGATP